MANEQLQIGGVLSEPQLTQLASAIAGFSPMQLTWASGYLAGLAQAGVAGVATAAQAPLAQAAAAGQLTILFGSQSGNAKGVATALKAAADAKGVNATLVSMADYKPKQLKAETHLLVVVSTHGEGDPPDEAEELHAFLGSKRAPKLDGLKYAVLGLGDSSYEFFCQTAKDFDERLALLGAERLLERVDLDVDYEEGAATWQGQTLELAAELLSTGPATAQVVPLTAVGAVASEYNKLNPFPATLLLNQKITGRDSVKDIRHFEIDLSESGLTYQPGDTLGIWFENDPQLVAELLALLKLDGAQQVKVDDQSIALLDALREKYELTQLVPNFVKAYAELSGAVKLAELVNGASELRDYVAERQVIDVVREYPCQPDAQAFVESLRRLTPRMYSIASSQAEVEEEVHLTIAVVRYDAFGQSHLGGASGYLAERLEEGATVKVFVEHNDHFRLPADPNTPVIMVGPGTGVAPFRAFMQERDASGAEGDNWLFFGAPTFTQDFLYQVEWQGYVKSGLLSRIDLAFSRDQEHKIYVQDRMRERGAELFAWLERGAHFYVCGDASRMAKDVHEALIDIVAEHAGKDREHAEAYVAELRRAKRYQRDVY